MPTPNVENLVYRLPYTVSSEDQKAMIEYGYSHASWGPRASKLFDDDGQELPAVFGRVQLRRPTPDSIKLIPGYDDMTEHQVSVLYRYHTTVKWEWIDTPITPIAQRLIDQVDHLYQQVNRVFLLLQNPEFEISAHADRFVNPHLSEHELSVQKRVNHNMALKYPLTEIPGNNGLPFIHVDGQAYQYEAQNNAFIINEVDTTHGALRCGFRRGVIFVDGIFDYDALLRETKLPVTLTEI